MASSSKEDFYLHCAKELTLKLKEVKDRALASAWIVRLETDDEIPEAKRIVYSKYLVYVLQRGALYGPFSQHPNNFKNLSDLPEDKDLFQINSLGASKKDKFNRAEEFVSDFSGDLRTYVAYQPIPDFGVHCYYAMSNQPITNWNRFDPSVFHSGRTPGALIGGLGPEKAKTETKNPEVEKRKTDFVEKLTKKVKADRKVLFAVGPIGKEITPEDQEFRKPPNWGSNLLSVRGLPRDE